MGQILNLLTRIKTELPQGAHGFSAITVGTKPEGAQMGPATSQQALAGKRGQERPFSSALPARPRGSTARNSARSRWGVLGSRGRAAPRPGAESAVRASAVRPAPSAPRSPGAQRGPRGHRTAPLRSAHPGAERTAPRIPSPGAARRAGSAPPASLRTRRRWRSRGDPGGGGGEGGGGGGGGGRRAAASHAALTSPGCGSPAPAAGTYSTT